MALLSAAWTLPLLPLAAFAFLLVTGRKLPRQAASGIGIATMSVVLAASVGVLIAVANGASLDVSVPWLRVGGLAIEFGIRLDPISAVMLVVVSVVSLLVQVYSIGYM